MFLQGALVFFVYGPSFSKTKMLLEFIHKHLYRSGMVDSKSFVGEVLF